MAKNSRGKRPCSICRKWFQPDPRQKGRQKTCSPECSREQHRRKCEQWNKKHRELGKNGYLDQKIKVVEHSLAEGRTVAVARYPPVLPQEIIIKEYGEKHLVILRYLIFQILKEVRTRRSGIP